MFTLEENNDVKIELSNIVAVSDNVYVILYVHNITDDDATLEINKGGANRFLYRSVKRGIFDYRCVVPYEPRGIYTIPANSFKEVQVVYSAPDINIGDEFNLLLEIYSCGYKHKCKPYLNFKAIENGWEISAIMNGSDDAYYESHKEKKQIVHYTENEGSQNEPINNPYDTLNSLVGLQSVKEEVITLANFVKIQKYRESKGLKSSPISYHCIFTGNPGTGKTTVARIVASIYKELGILKRGHLIETDRSGLVGQYVGHTAAKTNAIIDSALDGVLFIDEAYALVPSKDQGNDFGQEAVATLLKRMEDNRDRLVVILAGYSKEMKVFINSNSGLKSRFSRYIDFPDYCSDDLYKIWIRNLDEGGYSLQEEAIPELKKALCSIVESDDKNYGNGRYIRNLYEESLKAQANRLVSMSNIDDVNISVITIEDVITALSKVNSNIK